MAREVSAKGFIKLYRKAQLDEVFKNPYAWQLFCYCLFNAKFDNKYGEVGTLVVTTDELKQSLKWGSRTTVNKFMKFLKDGGYIDYKTSNKDTTIYVPNYSKYQD